jgi:hypothetical protein
MNLSWLKITLRCIATVLMVSAAIIFLNGGLSFRSETQTSSDTYQIHHTLIFSNSAIFPAVAGVFLFALSLIVPTKKV